MANKLYQPLLIESVKATADIEQHRFIGFDGAYCSAGAKALGVSDVSIENGIWLDFSTCSDDTVTGTTGNLPDNICALFDHGSSCFLT